MSLAGGTASGPQPVDSGVAQVFIAGSADAQFLVHAESQVELAWVEASEGDPQPRAEIGTQHGQFRQQLDALCASRPI